MSEAQRLPNAARCQDWAQVAQLIQSGYDVNATTETAFGSNAVLHYAASFKHLPTVALAIAHGANPNLRNGAAYTPLHYAFWKNLHTRASNASEVVDMCRLLVCSGGDVNTVTSCGISVLDMAARGYMETETGPLDLLLQDPRLVLHVVTWTTKEINAKIIAEVRYVYVIIKSCVTCLFLFCKCTDGSKSSLELDPSGLGHGRD